MPLLHRSRGAVQRQVSPVTRVVCAKLGLVLPFPCLHSPLFLLFRIPCIFYPNSVHLRGHKAVCFSPLRKVPSVNILTKVTDAMIYSELCAFLTDPLGLMYYVTKNYFFSLLLW